MKLSKLTLLFAAVAAASAAPPVLAQAQGLNRNFRTPSDSVNLDGMPVAAIVLSGNSNVTNNYYTSTTSPAPVPAPAPAPSYVYEDYSAPPAPVATPAPSPLPAPAPTAQTPPPPAPAPAPVTITTAPPPPPPAWVSTSCGSEGVCESTLVTPTGNGGYVYETVNNNWATQMGNNNAYAAATWWSEQP